MTERLYYQNSFLFNFTAALDSVSELADGRPALVLDRTAFYPTSGGQPFDTGWIDFLSTESDEPLALPKLRVTEVIEDEASGSVLHIVDNLSEPLPMPVRVRGFIDAERRQDHMQQHSGQHVLSAAFVRLFDAPTIGFHMGEQSSTIDLESTKLSPAQIEQAERFANQFVWEDRQVLMHEVTPEQARQIGVRKLPESSRETVRLIEVRGIDICACGGTHVRTSGQIGNIQVRKTERVRQGLRVEFVCGARALRQARKDFLLLAETAALYSAQADEVPAQARKLIELDKAAHHQHRRLLAEVAELTAQQTLARTPEEHGRKVIVDFLTHRDLEFVKLYAQQLTAAESNVIALLAAGQPTPALVFAHSSGAGFDAGAELRNLVSSVGGRGGGTHDLAQGGVPSAEMIPALLAQAAQRARSLASPGALQS
jgi:alanyl-tRNA synthetase